MAMNLSVMHLAVKSCFLHANAIFQPLWQIVISDASGKSIDSRVITFHCCCAHKRKRVYHREYCEGSASSPNSDASVTECTDFIPQNSRRYLGVEILL